uniref:procathepsin L-like n=1 Tax=Myxine glutinosa TaxID=7769 RepID=UPI00358E2A54
MCNPEVFLKILVLVLGVASAHIPDPALNPSWETWKQYYGKEYSATEENQRHLVWEKNLERILKHNLQYSLGKHSWTMEMNKFGDMIPEEFHKTMNGYRHPAGKLHGAHATFLPPIFFHPPPSIDWRDYGFVTKVKDQGSCGSCWAFSSTGALEGQVARYRHSLKSASPSHRNMANTREKATLVSLSEQNLVDCSRTEGNEGCGGGWMDQAFMYIRDNNGIESEQSYPYSARDDQQCLFDPRLSVASLSTYVDIPKDNETALKMAVASEGPVSVAIDASNPSFQFYSSGVYFEPNCNSSFLNHAVLAVGYGKVEQEQNGHKYWIIKNSWSRDWGDNGYILMARGRNNNCGIASAASFPLL